MTALFSVDVETDGLGPGVHSLLSIGIVRYRQTSPSEVVPTGDEFEINLAREPGYKTLASTMAFWDEFLGTRAAPLVLPAEAAKKLASWLDEQCPNVRNRIFVADPASFDFAMVSHLTHKYLERDLFHYKTVDLTSLRRGLGVSKETLAHVAASMNECLHTAIGDARVQGAEFAYLWSAGYSAHGNAWKDLW